MSTNNSDKNTGTFDKRYAIVITALVAAAMLALVIQYLGGRGKKNESPQISVDESEKSLGNIQEL